ncbi:MAG: D-alanine--D-alanine ligase [Ferruginibacter sp.]|nr:D-alanine--D-alanine ligase [Cytophagales bacterium]
MKVGIFFGGQSREREISFAGGRTVYDNLDKSLFEAVPVFVDSLGNFILLKWEFIYKGTIRDFYPPAGSLPPTPHGFQVYVESLGELPAEEMEALIRKVGERIQPHQFGGLFDFAFLALHGPYGEDGNIQGLLEWYNLPYSGSGILPSAIGTNKIVQDGLLRNAGFNRPKSHVITRAEWLNTPYRGDLLEKLTASLGLPFVIKSPNQGSSIGVTLLTEKDNRRFTEAVNRSFFTVDIHRKAWRENSEEQKVKFIASLTDIREGIGLPVYVGRGDAGSASLEPANGPRATANDQLIHHPEALLRYLDEQSYEILALTSANSEEAVLMEGFIDGKEFSCIVIQDENGKPLALPPTEIRKGGEVFSYRSKYLPGMSRKITPIQVPDEWLATIRRECERLFTALHCNVYARIDGFVRANGEVFLNDPNTTSGMLPSSFFFHQSAEIGLNPSQFLTYIIRTSLAERIRAGKRNHFLGGQLAALDRRIAGMHEAQSKKVRVGVIMGGFSTERHISVESGRNIYEKLSSSAKYEPVPVFLTGNEDRHELYVIPVNVMLKDNADDIREKIVQALSEGAGKHPVLQQITREAAGITRTYARNAVFEPVAVNYAQLAERVDEVFIALHGRPGEDGAVQVQLERYGIPYNGSGVESSRITINKYETNRLLRGHGIRVAEHQLIERNYWERDPEAAIAQIERDFGYPIIAKPADDGCSSAVKKIKGREELRAFGNLMFRPTPDFFVDNPVETRTLKLRVNEEFPQKDYFLIEELISRRDAGHFLEVTGGLLTHRAGDGSITYEIFEPSETLATGEVLSLEEKFLAGEGQNITPARFSRLPEEQQRISAQVRAELEKVARLLNIEGYARIDAFVRIFDDGRVETIIIEVNSLPGMTPATCIFHQTALNGYKPYHFIDAILEYGRTKQEVGS